MQAIEYNAWNWQEVYTQHGLNIYANDYMVCVKVNIYNYFPKNTSSRLVTFNIPVDYSPITQFYVPTNYRYLNMGIHEDGEVYYQNTATYDIDGTANALMIYPRKRALP